MLLMFREFLVLTAAGPFLGAYKTFLGDHAEIVELLKEVAAKQ